MSLRPIPGAPDDAPAPDFPTGPAGPPTPPAAPALATSVHWTARKDRIGAVFLAPRRGYGSTQELSIYAFTDGALALCFCDDDVVLPPVVARRLLNLWASGVGEFDYDGDPTIRVMAHWFRFDDAKPGFSIHLFHRFKSLSRLSGVTASERTAEKVFKELRRLQARSEAA